MASPFEGYKETLEAQEKTSDESDTSGYHVKYFSGSTT
jgi:hypothetical protein